MTTQSPNGQDNDSEYEYYYDEDEDAGYELRSPEDIKKLIDSLRAGEPLSRLAVPPPPPSSSGVADEDLFVTPPSTDRDTIQFYCES